MASLCLKGKKKIQIPLCGIRGPLCDTNSVPSLPLQPYFSKDPLVLLILSHAKCFVILQILWLFLCPCFGSSYLLFFLKFYLPKPSFPSLPPILWTNLSLKADSVQRPSPLRPSLLLLEFPTKQWEPKGQWSFGFFCFCFFNNVMSFFLSSFYYY